MYTTTFNRNTLRKEIKKILKQNKNFFNNYNLFYINKNPIKKTNVFTSLDVLEEFLPNKKINIIDLLDENNYLKIYKKLKNELVDKYNSNEYYVILNNKDYVEFKKELFKFLNNINIDLEERYQLFNILSNTGLNIE